MYSSGIKLFSKVFRELNLKKIVYTYRVKALFYKLTVTITSAKKIRCEMFWLDQGYKIAWNNSKDENDG